MSSFRLSRFFFFFFFHVSILVFLVREGGGDKRPIASFKAANSVPSSAFIVENWATYCQDVLSTFLIYSLTLVLQNGSRQTIQARTWNLHYKGNLCLLLVRGLYGPFGSNMVVHLLSINLIVIWYLVISCFYNSLFPGHALGRPIRQAQEFCLLARSLYPRVSPYTSNLLFPIPFSRLIHFLTAQGKGESVMNIFPLQNGSFNFFKCPWSCQQGHFQTIKLRFREWDTSPGGTFPGAWHSTNLRWFCYTRT